MGPSRRSFLSALAVAVVAMGVGRSVVANESVAPAAPTNLRVVTNEQPAPDASGWTTFAASDDTRAVFVSISSGNDANSGLSETEPVQTLAAGYARLRHGFPDWLLLKKGDVWREGFPTWKKGGRSATEPMLVATYGTGARPSVCPPSGDRALLLHKDAIGDLAFVGLDLYAEGRDPSSPAYTAAASQAMPTGVTSVGGLKRVLFEDCSIRFFATNVVIQEYTGPTPTNYRFHRCIISDAYSLGSHSQGMYSSDSKGLHISECIFDHNGWNEAVGAEATIFNHNVYLQGCDDVRIHDTVFGRASSFGIKLRSESYRGSVNLSIRDNLFVACGNTISVGGNNTSEHTFANVVFEGNVLTEIGRTINNAEQAYGLHFNCTDGGRAVGNYFLHKSTLGRTFALLVTHRPNRELDLSGNVMHEWAANGDIIEIDTTEPTVVVSNNLVDPDPATLVDPNATVARYAADRLRGQSSIDWLLTKCKTLSKSSWDPRLTAKEIVTYMKEAATLR